MIRKSPSGFMVWLLVLSLALPAALPAQSAGGGEETKFRPEQLDQMLAPIALYPDSLLAQTLAASTYALEVVQAARFAKENASLKGEALTKAAKDKDWDPSVKAMLEFPDVLQMMNEKLEWTQNLGDAFLGQQREVMESVQRLRTKAQDSGNLKSTKEQVVKEEPSTQVIIIEPASPEIIYVPAYNPVVVYGAWPYPAYPPYPYYPPSYVPGAAAFGFIAGVAIGAAWGGWGAWGCNWHGGCVNVNVNNYNNFTNKNYNSNKYQKNGGNKAQQWSRDSSKRSQSGSNRSQGAGGNRGGDRGYGGDRGGAGSNKAGAGSMDRGGAGSNKAGASSMNRGGGSQASAKGGSGGRSQATSFDGAGRGGADRSASARGSSSRSGGYSGGGRSSSGGSRSSGGYSGGSRGGGGRGGGGRGGGGRR
jgi:hypothetical protein